MVDVLKPDGSDRQPGRRRERLQALGSEHPGRLPDLAGQGPADNLWVNGALRSQYAAGQLHQLADTNTSALLTNTCGKVREDVDVVPADYTKGMHQHGVMAKVKFKPVAGNPTPGLFQGADHGLLRLSLAAEARQERLPAGTVVEGLRRWQAFAQRRGPAKLDWSGAELQFLRQRAVADVDAGLVDSLQVLFAAVSLKPTQLRVDHLAKIKQDGQSVSSVKAPTQVYFVPRAEVRSLFSTAAHDFRNDLVTLNAGTTLYDVYAHLDGGQDLDHPVHQPQLRPATAQQRGEGWRAGADLAVHRLRVR